MEQQPTQPVESTPVAVSYAPEQIEAIRRSHKTKTVRGIVCLIVPIILIVVAHFAYDFMNFMIIGTSGPDGPSTLETYSGVYAIANAIIFLIGAVGVWTWLPGIIVGIVLLASRPKI